MMSVSLYVVPSLYCAAVSRSRLLRLPQSTVMLLLTLCWFRQNLFSHFDTILSLSLNMVTYIKFLKFSPLPTTSDRLVTRGE